MTLPGRLRPELLALAADEVNVTLSDSVLHGLKNCREFVDSCMGDGREIYGATTGFGPLVTFAGRESAVDQCDHVLQHLTARQGRDLPLEVVRATVPARIWSLCQGRSGVSPAVVDRLCAMLRTSFVPAVPELGSVGASGDLVPVAHIAQALRGNGFAYFGGQRTPAAQALAEAGLSPLELDGRDALALVNGTSLTAAAAGLAARSIRRSHSVSIALTALLVDLLEAYGHARAASAGARMARLLAGVRPTGNRPLQEPYSVRCTPQLLGAAGSAIDYATSVVEDDLNGVSDNPLFFAEENLVAHGGNFFGQPCSFAGDLLVLVATQLGNLTERQLDLLVDPHRNTGLAPMLSVRPGVQHGVQGIQLVSTAIVVAMRRSATPASMQSLPTNLHNLDIVPFGTQAALNAWELSGLLRLLNGALAVGPRQAIHIGDRLPTAPACAELYERLAHSVAPVDPDRALDNDVRLAAQVLDDHVADKSSADVESRRVEAVRPGHGRAQPQHRLDRRRRLRPLRAPADRRRGVEAPACSWRACSTGIPTPQA
ncbi:histidine ammonia-lyase [Lentzea sp. NPDC059081]|uniref:HAL/PAL/TAL family ammonia-lyase n=1 Tax=Lentzea sp. NPDC059081 TaxID=3346719 RepID=UPI003682CB43